MMWALSPMRTGNARPYAADCGLRFAFVVGNGSESGGFPHHAKPACFVAIFIGEDRSLAAILRYLKESGLLVGFERI